MKLDILVLAVHPDDAELGCAGTILKHISLGHKVGIVDFTRGELGTRGTPAIREQEAANASGLLGVSAYENLNLADGFFENDKLHQLAVIQAIRKFQPEIVLANATHDRHSDHGRAAQLAVDSCFLSGLIKIETLENGKPQLAWRPRAMYHYVQSQLMLPDLIVDISGYWDKKMEAIRAYKSQFYDPASKEPESYVSNPHFLRMVEARAIEFGHAIGVKYGEGYTVRRPMGMKSLFDAF
jgi:bacillithiol biosynthesis deacetylase BshB1